MTPSSPQIIRVQAYAIRGTIPLKAVAAHFSGQTVSARKTELVVSYGGDVWAIVYDFGAVVFFDAEASEQARVMDLVRTSNELRPPLTEEFLVEVRDTSRRPSVFFDRIEVPNLTRPIVEIVALVVGQSVALEYYEEDVDGILPMIDAYSDSLEMRGRFRGSSRELLRFVGRATGLRNRALYTLALLDSPASAWNNETLELLHRNLRSSFGIPDRYVALEHKLTVVRDNLDLLVDLTRERRTFWLEFSVIALIAFEATLAVFGLFRGK